MVICKIIWIPESRVSRTFLLVESKILGFGIRNSALEFEIPLMIGIRSPISTDKESESSIWNRESKARNSESSKGRDIANANLK